jgi:hypothetical protein
VWFVCQITECVKFSVLTIQKEAIVPFIVNFHEAGEVLLFGLMLNAL